MKKLLVGLMVVLMTFVANPVLAETEGSSSTTITYDVEQKFTWSVPEQIVFTKNQNTDSKTGTVKVTECTIPSGTTAVISIDQINPLKNGNDKREYKVLDNGTELNKGDKVLSVPAGTDISDPSKSQKELTFELQYVDVQKAGTYTGTTVFKAEIKKLNRIGGVIYYDTEEDNGATYTFYDKDKKELTSYEGAYYYTVENKADDASDRYYVYATNDSGNLIQSEDHLNWSNSYEIVSDISNKTTAVVGSGKNDTEILVGKYVNDDSTIWYWINAQNTDKLNDNDDWFIGSYADLDLLNLNTDVLSSSYYVWSSSQDSDAPRYYAWGLDYGSWRDRGRKNRDDGGYAVALRAF